jgi:RNA polymerase sigma factor (sigma-70 family)
LNDVDRFENSLFAMSTTSTTQIREWLLRCRQGDRRARDELFEHVQSRLRSIVRSSLRGSFGPLREQLDSEDGLQELCVRLLQRWDRILLADAGDPNQDPVRAFFAAAAQAIRDILIDSLRRKYGRGKQARPEVVPIDRLAGIDSSGAGFQPSEDTHAPDQIAVWAEIHTFFDSLPEPLKQVADLRWYHDLSHAEVGEVLGCAEITARTHWTKIRHQLRERFTDFPFDWAI